jgi:hypothetical protein
MTRTSARFKLLIFLISGFLWSASVHAAKWDLPENNSLRCKSKVDFAHTDLLLLPESKKELTLSALESGSLLERFGLGYCQFSDRYEAWQISNKGNSKRREIAARKSSKPAGPSNNTTERVDSKSVNNGARVSGPICSIRNWIAESDERSSRNPKNRIAQLNQLSEEFYQWADRDWVSEWNQFVRGKMVSVHTVEKEASVSSDDEKSLDDKSFELDESENTDEYWQYYDDCDRWGVDFAILLNPNLVVSQACFYRPDESQAVLFTGHSLAEGFNATIKNFSKLSNQLREWNEFQAIESLGIQPDSRVRNSIKIVKRILVAHRNGLEKQFALASSFDWGTTTGIVHVKVAFKDLFSSIPTDGLATSFWFIAAPRKKTASKGRFSLRRNVSKQFQSTGQWLIEIAEAIQPPCEVSR